MPAPLIIHLIGTITLSCGTPATTAVDTCIGDHIKVEMLIPEGRLNEKICKEDNPSDPTIEPHEAFIRIRGKHAVELTPWPGALACDDTPPCVLYPIVKRA